MRWKDGVITEKKCNYRIRLGDNDMCIPDTRTYIAQLMENGKMDAEELEKIIMEHDQCDEISASLSLAQFIVDYGEFIEEEDSYYRIID